MKIYKEMSLREFEPWSGAVDTYELIISNGKEDDFELLIEEVYPNGIDEIALNDLLWFDSEWVLESLDIEEEEEEEDFD